MPSQSHDGSFTSAISHHWPVCSRSQPRAHLGRGLFNIINPRIMNSGETGLH